MSCIDIILKPNYWAKKCLTEIWGRCTTYHLIFCIPTPPPTLIISVSPRNIEGVSLWDVGLYLVSLAHFVFESPLRSAFVSQVCGSTGCDVSFTGQLEYSGGCVGHIMSSYRGPFETHATIVAMVLEWHNLRRCVF